MPKIKNIDYIHFDSVGSTNTWVKEHTDSLKRDNLTCVSAAEQTQGRGRFHRKWISPKGKNIYATFHFCLPPGFASLANLGQILSLSCIAVLKKMGFAIDVKWPNDLLLGGKKLAGILCETLFFPDRIAVALGIGLNVNMSDEELKAIDQPAASLTGVSKEELLNAIAHQLLHDLNRLIEEGFSPFAKEYEKHLSQKGKKISISNGAQRYEGVCLSIDATGKLLIQLPDGTIQTLSAGEISNQNGM